MYIGHSFNFINNLKYMLGECVHMLFFLVEMQSNYVSLHDTTSKNIYAGFIKPEVDFVDKEFHVNCTQKKSHFSLTTLILFYCFVLFFFIYCVLKDTQFKRVASKFKQEIYAFFSNKQTKRSFLLQLVYVSKSYKVTVDLFCSGQSD